MTDITIEADAFAKTITQILGRVETGVERGLPEALKGSLEVGQRAWKKNARAVLSKSYSRGGWGKARGYDLYKSGKKRGQVKKVHWYGRTYKTGKYANSISHHVMRGGSTPEGEIGSRSLPGLPHLLEKGHASVGGGFVGGREHIAPAAEEAFEDFEQRADLAVERALNDA